MLSVLAILFILWLLPACGGALIAHWVKLWPAKPAVWARIPLETNRIHHRSPMQIEQFQPEGKRIMPESRFTEFSALSVDPRVGISRSASETDVWLFFFPVTLKIVIHYLSFLSFLTFFRHITAFTEHCVFFAVVQK